jgi:hypothetical protein
MTGDQRHASAHTYWKVPFEWPGDRIPPREPDPPLVAWSHAADVPELSQLVGTVLADSVDPSDNAAVAALGPHGAAEKILAPAQGFSIASSGGTCCVTPAPPPGSSYL